LTDLSNVDETRTSRDLTIREAPTQTRTISDIVEHVGFIRSSTHLLAEDAGALHNQAGDIHNRAIEAQITERSHQLAAQGAPELLSQLSEAGLSWRDIARMCGVSVPAVRRWRNGDPPTGDHLHSIATLLALREIAERDHFIHDFASWIEVPLYPPFPLNGVDLISAGHTAELLELAGQHVTPEEVLDRVSPSWRQSEDSGFEVFETEDGEMGIRSGR
jgi:transcriptional regulator with XRE-family HTH domain